jgi:hypothetical protein
MVTEREEIFRAIQAALAGHSEKEVIGALLSSLVVAIGVSAESLSRAEAVINALPAELMPLLRAEWPKLRRHRTVAGLATDIEDALKR